MLRLLTFGGLRVLRDDGGTTDLSNQRRRLAVLAVVAAEAPRGVSRERLLLLLWPDADAEKGRHALNQIVYNLRRELGESPIAGTAELTLAPEVMSCDLLDFRAAIARGDHQAAAELYQGAFLEGFFVPGATEFDHWADDERLRTQRQAVTALSRLATAAEVAGDLDAWVRWTQRLVDLDPLSAQRALAHMHALEASGDPDAAVAYGRRYEALVLADGDEADPAVASEVERLRRLPAVVRPTPTPRVPAPAVATASPSIAAPETPTSPADKSPPHVFALSPTLDAEPGTTSGRARRSWRWLPPVAAAIAIMAGGLAFARAQSGTLPLRRGDRILLADVQVPTADSANARALAFALQSALQQSSRVHLVSPMAVSDALRRMGRPAGTALPDSTASEVAEREAARYVVSLGVTAAAATRVVSLRVLDPATGAVVRSFTTTVAPTALLGAIDLVAGKLRRELGDSPDDVTNAMPLPRATTPSLEALRLYAGGRMAANRALYRDARTLYEGALVLDSGFAAAHAGLAYVSYVFNDVPDGDRRMARALSLANRLPTRERLLIEAIGARGGGDWQRAASLHRAYLIRYPDDYDTYAALGYELMRSGEEREALEAYDTLQAHRTVSAGDWFNIASIHSSLGEYVVARKAHVAALALDTAFLLRAMQNEQIGRLLLTLGHSDSARVVHMAIAGRAGQEQARGLRALAYVDLYEGRYASAVQRLRRAIEIYGPDPSARLSEVRDRALLARTLADLGERDAALTQLAVAARTCVTTRLPPQALFWTGKSLLRLGDVARARPLLDSAKARTRRTDKSEQAATLAFEAEYLAAEGKLDAATALAAQAANDGKLLADLIDTQAYVLERSGALPAALAVRQGLGARLAGAIELEGQQSARLAPLAMARIQSQLGQHDDALRTIGAFMERWPSADANLPMLTVLRAQITARRGSTTAAAPTTLSP